MNRLAKLLARFSPRAWKNRYATEFEALLDQRTPRVRDAFDILLGALKMQLRTWSFVRLTLATALAGALAAVAYTYTLPARYVSQAPIFVEPGIDAAGRAIDFVSQTPLPLSVRPGPDAAHQPTHPLGPDDVRAVLLAPAMANFPGTDFLVSLIQKYGLYPREQARMPLDAIAKRMQRDITIRPLHPSGSSQILGFTVNFSYFDPHVAQQVDGDLVSLWLQRNLLATAQAAGAGHPHTPMAFVVTDPHAPMVFVVKDSPSSHIDARTHLQRPNRMLFAAAGLLAGLASGLMLAAMARLRKNNLAAGA